MTSRWRGAQRHYDEQDWAVDKLDPGWAKARLNLRTLGLHRFGHGPDEVLCRTLPEVAEALDGIKRRLEAGATIEILHGVQLCAHENVPLPTWLANAFLQRLGMLLSVNGPLLSLDEAFADLVPATTAKKAAKAKQDWAIGHMIFAHMHQHSSEHGTEDAAVKAAIAALRPGVGLTTARRLAAHVDSVYFDKQPGHVPFSQIWPKGRKKVE